MVIGVVDGLGSWDIVGFINRENGLDSKDRWIKVLCKYDK